MLNFPENGAVIIPRRNEAPPVETVRRFVPSVFVVNDGSTDATGGLAERAGATVPRHLELPGHGAVPPDVLETRIKRWVAEQTFAGQ
jgi:glycosyltransferase involved in cell wall biosynthesis